MPLPHVVSARAPGDTVAAMFETQGEELRKLLLAHGAILFRGFGVDDETKLTRVLDCVRAETMSYFGGISPRQQLGKNIYTATELPADLTVPLHSELSYLAEYPRHLWFACSEAPREGGETLLADSRAIWCDMDADTKRRFIDHGGVRYRCSFHGESLFFSVIERFQRVTKSWMETFETTDRHVVEERCQKVGAHVEWLPSGRLVMETVRPAVVTHPETGEPLWFNSAHLFRLSRRELGWMRYVQARLFFLRRETRTQDAHYGDGADIENQIVERLFDLMDDHTALVRWERGDLVWIDNLLCMHGRAPYRGRRRLLAAMTR
jgi:alpha-ketoglutarate-dependent taurine dioxygenase